MNLDALKAQHLNARKQKDAAHTAVLGRVIGDVETLAKNKPGTDQAQLIAGVLTDQLAALLREREQLAGLGRDTAQIDLELPVLQNLHTQATEAQRQAQAELSARQLSPEALEGAIREAVTQGAGNIGAVMQFLKTQHDGAYDGKLASETTRRILAEAKSA
ncbi:hypothetical protein E7T06_20670 [Deinococcus sp. Arct2-2]|uniref:hypothetical protein n=1 Tax=Deinococcus sp. Arct2-2 TaxID=2568653 RepID=UPI0010A3F2F7|nr:hypothetical protein [Deinococcus sp. Arct2-2]THF66716.1 hypothetical protein E7T06_20670 [Deinococcus sp. Arct2-2]